MTRRRRRGDSVGDHVSHQLTWEKADQFFADIFHGFFYDLPGLLEIAEQSHRSKVDTSMLRYVLKALRQPELRGMFAADESSPTRAKSCKACGWPLPQPGPGTRGRRPEHCNPACKQLAYRRRKGQKPQTPVRPTIPLLFTLFELEVELLRESAHRAVEERHRDHAAGSMTGEQGERR
ncbi:hypothetical protein [Nocardia brevicatena]|uniref:hypothetical protein n=1 Tax=Nocardia brevicatena TaxID=37327 RepID=UPI0002F30EAA|nr:hypothetical protein [Nocardia brevicatena]